MSTTTSKPRTARTNNTSIDNGKVLATRSTASQKGGKPGTRRSAMEFTPAELREMKKLKALGISMTGISRIIGRTKKGIKYYDIWKVFNN